ncbi:hypothetical protein GCM10011371_13110 [Novosphingobium marinum]|uniref:Uncharacterized protein n=1 Tax=Novosphingobium marinum TaxID=1514948 RepID=A0A7Z0BTQ7_9SPHN|nr:hypothetical protein [Novosphingobium marinum]NYH95419.1 hypothetical protein [Novosphingobium marinum]GGC26902.1 hypothetical protein GCM10011371_13110 [Novosphingobium marinum]
MAEVAIPPIVAKRGWRGVILETAHVAGREMTSVTGRIGLGRAARRRWFPDRALALAHALELAEAHGVGLFDLGEAGPEE